MRNLDQGYVPTLTEMRLRKELREAHECLNATMKQLIKTQNDFIRFLDKANSNDHGVRSSGIIRGKMRIEK